MNSCEYATVITALACSIVDCVSEDEAALLVVVFTQLADTIDTILTRNDFCSKQLDENESSVQRVPESP